MKILKSLFIMVVAAAVVAGSTYAYFSDTGTSTGNTFTAGTLNLKLRDTDELSSVDDLVTAEWTGSAMAPGGTSVAGTVVLRNERTVNANHVEVVASNTCSVATMDQYLEVAQLKYNGSSILGTVADANANGYVDLGDLTAVNAIDDLSLTDLNASHAFDMSVRLHSSTPNTFQGANCVSTFMFTLNQDATQ